MRKRIENSDNKDWEDHIGDVLLTYNHKMVNRSTGMTPYEAKKDKKMLNAKQHLELHARHDRLYLDINVGDKVKIYTKKKIFGKQHKSVWSVESYNVDSIDSSHGQLFYKTSAGPKPFM